MLERIHIFHLAAVRVKNDVFDYSLGIALIFFSFTTTNIAATTAPHTHTPARVIRIDLFVIQSSYLFYLICCSGRFGQSTGRFSMRPKLQDEYSFQCEMGISMPSREQTASPFSLRRSNPASPIKIASDRHIQRSYIIERVRALFRWSDHFLDVGATSRGWKKNYSSFNGFTSEQIFACSLVRTCLLFGGGYRKNNASARYYLHSHLSRGVDLILLRADISFAVAAFNGYIFPSPVIFVLVDFVRTRVVDCVRANVAGRDACFVLFIGRSQCDEIVHCTTNCLLCKLHFD